MYRIFFQKFVINEYFFVLSFMVFTTHTAGEKFGYHTSKFIIFKKNRKVSPLTNINKLYIKKNVYMKDPFPLPPSGPPFREQAYLYNLSQS